MLHAFNVTQVCLRDQLEKVLCFSQGHNTYDLQLVFGMVLDFVNTIASIHPVIDVYAFKFRMMTPCCEYSAYLDVLWCVSLFPQKAFF